MTTNKGLLLFLCLWLPVLAGCHTFSHRLPPVDVTQPGWKVRQGQAVWTLPNSAHDVAGEVLVATGPGEKAFVQFSKSPFNLVIGQVAPDRWQVEFPPQNKSYAAPGKPPKRLLWLYLPRAIANQSLPPNCTWTNQQGNWSLQNHRTGEKIEGFFEQ